MPGGGRGTIESIARAINIDDSDDTIESIKSWIKGGYEIRVTSIEAVASAVDICYKPKKLREIWCYAINHNRVSQEY